jgi:hypothetical protein
MTILREAEELIRGERAVVYGDAKINHDRIAALWNAYITGKYGVSSLEAIDAAIMMMLVKIARLEHTPNHRDSYVDIAGYAELGDWITND